MRRRGRIISLLLLACLVAGAAAYHFYPRPLTMDLREDPSVTCHLHGCKLAEELVPNEWGLDFDYFSEDYYKAKLRLFLRENGDPWGVEDKRVRSFQRSYCPECREAKRRWWETRSQG